MPVPTPPPPPPKIGCEFSKKKILALCTVMVWGGFDCFDGSHDGYANQGCGNTIPDLSNLVPLHSGQVKNFYLLVLGQVQMYYTGVTNYRCTSCLRQAIKQTILQKPMNYILLNWSFILSIETNYICFKIKFNLLKT